MKKLTTQILYKIFCTVANQSFLSNKMSSAEFPPVPSWPLVRQIADGGGDAPHDYYADVCYDEPVEIYEMETVERALRSSLPENVVPHIVYKPTHEGAAFRVELRPLLDAPIPGVIRFSELSIPETLVWDYIVYDYLCYLNSRMRPAIGFVQRVVFADAAERHTGLYRLLCSYVIK